MIIDKAKGLYYNYHRWYNPETGRYIQMDKAYIRPFLSNDLIFYKYFLFLSHSSENTYFYSMNNPINYYDFYGLSSEEVKAGDRLAEIWEMTEGKISPFVIGGGIIVTGELLVFSGATLIIEPVCPPITIPAGIFVSTNGMFLIFVGFDTYINHLSNILEVDLPNITGWKYPEKKKK